MPARTWPGPTQLPAGPGPLPHRLVAAVLDALVRGELAPGDALPSTRSAAAQLRLSRGVVVAAYDELAAAGYVEARMGGRTVVVDGADRAARPATPTAGPVGGDAPAPDRVEEDAVGVPTPPAGDLDLRPGHAEPELISSRDWRAAWRHAIPDRPGGEGLSRVRHPDLEQALAAHLRRFRGVPCTPEDVVIVPNASAAFTLLAAAAGLRGRTVAVEDPGYRRARVALTEAGARVRPVPVDDDGLDPALLLTDDAAVYLTPAHQYPLGARMPVARRAELVTAAVREGRLVVEDDYDGEFRYGVPPMPSVRAVDGAADCVAHVGTASKILTPDLGLAWVVPPRGLVGEVRRAQDRLALGASPIASTALAHLVASGALGRHLARASRLYRARRDALVTALMHEVPEARVTGVEAGLHLVVLLRGGADDDGVAARLRERGVWVEPLSAYCLGEPRSGLVIGYARLPETRAPSVARDVARAVTARP
ncbi:PLP-dependent aminotransferase family protein [uncultured Serinicoccus sp.]|uniref:MocR-like pyridoxine biosynthesis transcription factor PdxR n=1 Tax=uncultured Serinicoccus sp. TaxID=735514 RepID=UPI00262568E8|nr:PLP-dependent aminotransferase family protein [uncultured Serinicoccus sp.]